MSHTDDRDKEEDFKRLKEIYYDTASPGAYGGVEKLARLAKAKYGISRNSVVKFLQDQDTYTLHKPVRRRYVRNQTVVSDIEQQWQADLADMRALSRHNGGTHFLLTVIDCFSRFAWVLPVKRKDAPNMLRAFQYLLEQHAHPHKPRKLQTDHGHEFFNRPVQEYLKSKHGIDLFATHSTTKAAMVERFNRTLKQLMWRYFTAHKTRRYLDVLQDLVAGYNNTLHRTIGHTPHEVANGSHALREQVWLRLYRNRFARAPSTNTKSLAQPGEHVRISKQKATFTRGYMPGWSEERFRVTHAQKRAGAKRAIYKLEDWNAQPIQGSLYPEEVQKIAHKTDADLFRIERLIRKRRDTKPSTVGGSGNGGGSKALEYLVKWRDWPESHNSWISQAEYDRLK